MWTVSLFLLAMCYFGVALYIKWQERLWNNGRCPKCITCSMRYSQWVYDGMDEESKNRNYHCYICNKQIHISWPVDDYGPGYYEQDVPEIAEEDLVDFL